MPDTTTDLRSICTGSVAASCSSARRRRGRLCGVRGGRIGRSQPWAKVRIAPSNEESTAAKEWIGDPRDVDLVGGDFNLPIESAVYRRHWGDFTNAFSSVGTGLGRTKRTRLIGVRIDHLLVGSRLAARIASIGPDLGSDHRPLVCDFHVTGSPDGRG